MENNKKILLMGLPSTGKTTFIAALWHLVKSETVKKSLELNTLADSEHEYLNKIHKEWLTYSAVSRTIIKESKQEHVIMNLKRVDSGQNVILDIPDFSGETFKSHFENREWTVEYNEIIKSTDGFILFINPCDPNNKPVLISHANDIGDIFADAECGDSVNTSIDPKSWEISMVPNQVKLVELLQFIVFHHDDWKNKRISVVISAWDQVITNSEITPGKWLEINMPLFYQYLISNGTFFSSKCFGISGQGFDYDDESQLDEFVNKEDPVCRILVVDGENSSNDIAQPLLWATE